MSVDDNGWLGPRLDSLEMWLRALFLDADSEADDASLQGIGYVLEDLAAWAAEDDAADEVLALHDLVRRQLFRRLNRRGTTTEARDYPPHPCRPGFHPEPLAHPAAPTSARASAPSTHVRHAGAIEQASSDER